VATLVAACDPGASFTTAGACLVDGRASGAYPELEALIPTSLGGQAPTTLDSGRNCSDKALGTLVAHGVHELRFAGATWDRSGGAGTSIAVLALPTEGLPVAWIEEFYEVGAQTASKTDHVTPSRPTFPGVGSTFRVDVLNDLSFQSIVVWPDGPRARVVIVASPVSPSASMADHEAQVTAAMATAATFTSSPLPVLSPP
jgi:hypothetical protein